MRLTHDAMDAEWETSLRSTHGVPDSSVEHIADAAACHPAPSCLVLEEYREYSTHVIRRCASSDLWTGLPSDR
jgi:hypothetical protein